MLVRVCIHTPGRMHVTCLWGLTHMHTCEDAHRHRGIKSSPVDIAKEVQRTWLPR